MHHRILTVLCLLLACPHPSFAQHTTYADYRSDVAPAPAPLTPHRAALQSTSDRRASFETVAVGGLLGWGTGLAAGGLVGYALRRSSGESYFGEAEWWIGAWIGSSLGAAYGAHLANSGRGNLLVSSLGALVSVPAVFAVAIGVPVIGAPALLALPAAPILTSVFIERGTSPPDD